MTTYNFFIEKSNYTTNEITIRPEYPIVCNDKERLSFKLVDFKYLNSQYNISELLHNNNFSVISYLPAYVINNITNVPATNYDIAPYAIASPTFLDDATRTFNSVSKIETLTGADYTLYYFANSSINTPYLQKSNFRDTFNTNFVRFDSPTLQPNYITIGKNNTSTHTDAFILQKVYVKMVFPDDNNPIQQDLILTWSVQGSYDNILFDSLTETNNLLTIPQGFINGETLININNNLPYKYYRVFITDRNVSYSNNLLKLDKMYFYKAGTTITNVPDSTNYYSVAVNDGFYNIDNLITTINANSTSANAKITFAKQDYTNKIIITNSTPLATTPSVEVRTLVFPNLYTANMYGFNERLVSLNNAPITSDTYVNIMNFSKIIISTDLDFNICTYNDISKDSSPYTKGIGNILEWIDCDLPPMTCIAYKNIENSVHRLDNRFISQFKLIFCTEKSLPIVLDNFLIHLQIIKYKK
jgi:hypothetical protein